MNTVNNRSFQEDFRISSHSNFRKTVKKIPFVDKEFFSYFELLISHKKK